jgi:hypothetical protein
MRLTYDKKSIRKILHLIEATIVFHNMVLDIGDEEREDWINRDDASALDDESRVPLLSPTDVLNQSVPQNVAKDKRRKRLLYYFELVSLSITKSQSWALPSLDLASITDFMSGKNFTISSSSHPY